MNTELRKKAKKEFEKNFLKLINNTFFGKTMENVRNHRDIKLVTSDKRRKLLVSEPNYHSHKKFSDHLMAIEMKKTRVKMTKSLYLGMSILDSSKILMYEFWYDYIRRKYGDRAKLCYTDTDSSILDSSKILMYGFWYDYIRRKYGDRAKLCYTDTDNFIIYIKTQNFFEDISNDVEGWFDTSYYDKNDKRPFTIGKSKKVPDLFKDELGGKIMTEAATLRPKTYAYLDDDGSGHKKAKGTKKCVIKQKHMFENFKDYLFNNKNIYRSQERLRSYNHDVYTEKVNKIALSSNDDKRLQTSDRVITYPYGTSEMIMMINT